MRPCFLSGLEQCKAREDESGKEEPAEDESGGKDVLIRRSLSSMVGQAISVVGGYSEKPPTPEVPAVKRLPEPILPSVQTK